MKRITHTPSHAPSRTVRDAVEQSMWAIANPTPRSVMRTLRHLAGRLDAKEDPLAYAA